MVNLQSEPESLLMNKKHDKEDQYVFFSECTERSISCNQESSKEAYDRCSWLKSSNFHFLCKEYAFVFTGVMAQAFNQAGGTMILPLVNVLSDSFHGKFLLNSYPMVCGSFMLIGGRLGEVHGYKETLLGGYIILILSSLLGGLSRYSKSSIYYVICRAFQGVGMALILPNFSAAYDYRYQSQAKAHRKTILSTIIGCGASTGAFLGTFLSGICVTRSESNWSWAYYTYTIAATLTLALSYYSVPDNIPKKNKPCLNGLGWFSNRMLRAFDVECCVQSSRGSQQQLVSHYSTTCRVCLSSTAVLSL